ncbi:hypothetical protein N7541_004905 [Penicillium brevicompactum]|uniref:WSC domain-containing protein n=1 Tax=Penicillium brevicompactum TaxID=5074 RepID=A0A9W9UUE5_PENBR|nr:hypothetical protein N7541_004905 [Penicillium brevicompactum]
MRATSILSVLAFALPVFSASGLGCYSEIPSLKSQGPYSFNSLGYCQSKCIEKEFKFAALTRGNMCYCGNTLPSQSNKVDDEKCNTVCPGYPVNNCGGADAYTLVQASEDEDITDLTSESASTAASTAAPTAVTAAGGIVVAPSTAPAPSGIVTAASSVNSKSANSNSNSNSSKSAGSATTAATSSTSPTPTGNAADTIRVGSPLIGAVVAGMGLLL